MLRALFAYLLISGAVAIAQTAPVTSQVGKGDEIKTLDQLQKALDSIQEMGSVLSPEQKTFYANQVRAEYEINRRKAEDAYANDLHRALDIWYANAKSWRKIPAETWSKLTERDRGRIKDGIDPEVVARPCSGDTASR